VEPIKKVYMSSETVEIQLTEEEFNILAMAAHELDITFNQFVNQIVRDQLQIFEVESLS
jgi:hypothetical protein